MKNRDVYIGFGLRTPIGIKGKQFKHYRPELLGAHLLNQIKKIESESN
ncbi:acetyl-CoA C-acyltransferase, partial [Streptococcus agalactiae]|nr:acetyl-CoA C-acyltransferase [Streptococcus agalactiae]